MTGYTASTIGTAPRSPTHDTSVCARQPKPMHPLQVLGLLSSRYRKLLTLDDPAIATTKDAHAALGGKGSRWRS